MPGIAWLYENESHGYAICVRGSALDGRTNSIGLEVQSSVISESFCGVVYE